MSLDLEVKYLLFYNYFQSHAVARVSSTAPSEFKARLNNENSTELGYNPSVNV